MKTIFTITNRNFATLEFAIKFVQKNNLNMVNENNTKKISINAMYYSLEEVFYKANNFYPQSISSSNLKSVDPDLFTDPNGIEINTAGSAYSYKPLNCSSDGKCKNYELKATLSKEADYIKSSQNNKP